uniref:Uncharacterized protein n=1 Tax=Myoviridae sp. ctNQV2 TaxID=2827683 RepID=A0A8S5RZM6_9CAUD|nr:MAG TPA: hypothetical protein [Myoviridae sp. ctNQV2]
MQSKKKTKRSLRELKRNFISFLLKMETFGNDKLFKIYS